MSSDSTIGTILDDTKTFTYYQAPVQPDEGEWYEIQVYKYPDNLLFFQKSEPYWIVQGDGSTSYESLIPRIEKLQQVYANVRVRKTERTILDVGK